MSNQAASGLLSTSDVAVLQVLAREPLRQMDSTLELTLESGKSVQVKLSRVRGAHRGALVRVDPRPVAPRTPLRVGKRPAAHDGPGRAAGAPPPVLVAGPPGSGRTTTALRLAVESGEPVTVLRASEALVDGTTAWAQAFATRRQGAAGLDLRRLDRPAPR